MEMDWINHATCRTEGHDPELFFPVGSSGPALLQIEQAKTVCARCPVASDCLKYALNEGIEFGVWGGMSEEEREKLTRKLKRRKALQAAVS